MSDGDMSTLANMKHNLELNQLRIGTGVPERSCEDSNVVSYIATIVLCCFVNRPFLELLGLLTAAYLIHLSILIDEMP